MSDAERSTRATTQRTVPTNGGDTTPDDQPAYLDHEPASGDRRNLRCPECSQRVRRISGLRDNGTARIEPCGHRVTAEVVLA